MLFTKAELLSEVQYLSVIIFVLMQVKTLFWCHIFMCENDIGICVYHIDNTISTSKE